MASNFFIRAVDDCVEAVTLSVSLDLLSFDHTVAVLRAGHFEPGTNSLMLVSLDEGDENTAVLARDNPPVATRSVTKEVLSEYGQYAAEVRTPH